MRYKSGVDNIEILDRVRQHYDRDMNDSAIRTMIDNIVQSYIEYVKRGLSREEYI